ncbi:hypothetical protein AB0I10_00275 [Streptomyces sp. NPDC050636]|uniref:hypothetical protein n=1 Tax=Streptomyces sp. NPDC050636 TaxID=3154510 RepID=UPI0034167719
MEFSGSAGSVGRVDDDGSGGIVAKERDFNQRALAKWLGLELRHVRRAETRGLIPPPDVDDERWSEAVAKTLPDRVEEILAVVGDENYAFSAAHTAEPEGKAGRRKLAGGRTFGPHQLADELRLERWQVSRAEQRGLIPPRDVDGKHWSQEAVGRLYDRVEEIRAVLGDHPGLGSIKAAEYLAGRTRLEVERADVQALAEQGLLQPVGQFKQNPVYGLGALDELTEEQIAAVIQERHDWVERSLTAKEAAAFLGWPAGKFEVTAERAGLRPGRLGRYGRAEVEELCDRPGAGSG